MKVVRLDTSAAKSWYELDNGNSSYAVSYPQATVFTGEVTKPTAQKVPFVVSHSSNSNGYGESAILVEKDAVVFGYRENVFQVVEATEEERRFVPFLQLLLDGTYNRQGETCLYDEFRKLAENKWRSPIIALLKTLYENGVNLLEVENSENNALFIVMLMQTSYNPNNQNPPINVYFSYPGGKKYAINLAETTKTDPHNSINIEFAHFEQMAKMGVLSTFVNAMWGQYSWQKLGLATHQKKEGSYYYPSV